MGQVEVSFEDLPLVVDSDYEAGLISGSCNVHYYNDDDDWFVKEIYLNGYGIHGKMRAIEIDSTNNWLYTTIWSQLQEGRFARQIEREIAKDREAMRQEAAERRYERMREER